MTGGHSQEADSVLLEAARAMMAISVRAAVPGGISAIQLRARAVPRLGTVLGRRDARHCRNYLPSGVTDLSFSGPAIA